MRRYRFHHVDVFAEAPLEGNPLGVFPDARGLSDGEMQALGRELPFAGHPLVGTPWVMAREGAFPLAAPRTEVRHEVQAGLLPVTLETEPDRRRRPASRAGRHDPGAPAGMVEDPATGSAAGCLGAYLAAVGRLPGGRLAIRQGVEMRRPSRLDVTVEGGAPETMTVRLAGRVEPVITGIVTLRD